MRPLIKPNRLTAIAAIVLVACSSAGAALCPTWMAGLPRLSKAFDGKRSDIPYAEAPVTPLALLAAHRTGYLPDRNANWILPDVRGVEILEGESVHGSARPVIAAAIQSKLRIVWNQATERVIDECAAVKRQEGNAVWMTPEVISGYKELYRQGYVFSLELWDPNGNLVAGLLGIFSNGHVQGISKFRSMESPYSDGSGNILKSAERYFFWSRGVELIDVEVAVVDGRFAKKDVTPVARDEFALTLARLNELNVKIFEGHEMGSPLPKFESDFFARFQEMQAARDYRFQRPR